MDIFTFLANNPFIIVLGLMGLSLVTTASLLGRPLKPVKQPVRVDWRQISRPH